MRMIAHYWTHATELNPHRHLGCKCKCLRAKTPNNPRKETGELGFECS